MVTVPEYWPLTEATASVDSRSIAVVAKRLQTLAPRKAAAHDVRIIRTGVHTLAWGAANLYKADTSITGELVRTTTCILVAATCRQSRAEGIRDGMRQATARSPSIRKTATLGLQPKPPRPGRAENHRDWCPIPHEIEGLCVCP